MHQSFPFFVYFVITTLYSLLHSTDGYSIHRHASSSSQSPPLLKQFSRLFAQKFDPSTFIKVSIPKPLGLSLEENEPNKARGVFISSVGDGNAKKSGKLSNGLYLLEVAGTDVKYKDFDSIIDLISSSPADAPLDLVFVSPKNVYQGPAQLTVFTPEGQALTINTYKGQNLRTVLQGSKVDIYSGNGKFSNCGGAGQCRTCVVKVTDNDSWEKRADFEEKALGKKYDSSARLSCNTIVEGDCTVFVKPNKSV
jgi:ferredoxin